MMILGSRVSCGLMLAVATVGPLVSLSGCSGDDNPATGSISVSKKDAVPPPPADSPKGKADAKGGMGIKERMGLDK